MTKRKTKVGRSTKKTPTIAELERILRGEPEQLSFDLDQRVIGPGMGMPSAPLQAASPPEPPRQPESGRDPLAISGQALDRLLFLLSSEGLERARVAALQEGDDRLEELVRLEKGRRRSVEPELYDTESPSILVNTPVVQRHRPPPTGYMCEMWNSYHAPSKGLDGEWSFDPCLNCLRDAVETGKKDARPQPLAMPEPGREPDPEPTGGFLLGLLGLLAIASALTIAFSLFLLLGPWPLALAAGVVLFLWTLNGPISALGRAIQEEWEGRR